MVRNHALVKYPPLSLWIAFGMPNTMSLWLIIWQTTAFAVMPSSRAATATSYKGQIGVASVRSIGRLDQLAHLA